MGQSLLNISTLAIIDSVCVFEETDICFGANSNKSVAKQTNRKREPYHTSLHSKR